MTTDQSQMALDHANHVRLQHAQIVAAIRAAGRRTGAHRAIEVIEDRGASITYWRLLKAVRGVADRRARNMLNRSAINPEARINDRNITDRQRNLLIGQLVRYAEGARS